jgi:hypothetical protein
MAIPPAAVGRQSSTISTCPQNVSSPTEKSVARPRLCEIRRTSQGCCKRVSCVHQQTWRSRWQSDFSPSSGLHAHRSIKEMAAICRQGETTVTASVALRGGGSPHGCPCGEPLLLSGNGWLSKTYLTRTVCVRLQDHPGCKGRCGNPSSRGTAHRRNPPPAASKGATRSRLFRRFTPTTIP